MINRDLAESARKLMRRGSKPGDPDTPVAMWREKDRLRGIPEESAVVIFRTTGCSWYGFSSCTMCGYFNDISSDIKEENLMKQIDRVYSGIGDAGILKVFTSGSFLDPHEIPVSVRNYFFERLRGKVDKYLIESRTEYLNEKNLRDSISPGGNIRIAIGLESSNDSLIRDSINKGSTFSKFVASARVARELGFEIRTYLLFKPPFLSESASMVDIMNSVRDAAPYSNDISVNPMNIQRNTYVEYLWKRGIYRPPRLWSVARLLSWALNSGFEVVSYPTGGNKLRGAHNTEGDGNLLRLIYDTSLTQNPADLDSYLQSSDLTAYENELDIESRQAIQTDYFRMAGRMSSLSARI